MEIFFGVVFCIIHLILFGENLLVVGAVVVDKVRHDKAWDLLMFTEMYQLVPHDLQHLPGPAVCFGPELDVLQLTDTAVWTSVQMPADTSRITQQAITIYS